MRLRTTLVATLVMGATVLAFAGAGSSARAQTPSPTATAAPLAPCPTGTLAVSAPTTAAPTTVNVTISPALGNLKAASAADRSSVHLHYFIDATATPAGTLVPTGNPSIIHSGVLSQDLGTLAAGSHTVVVVVGQLDHRACELRGQVTFTTSAAQAAATPAAVTPPKTGSGGLLGGGAPGATTVAGVAALLATGAALAGGAALARRRR